MVFKVTKMKREVSRLEENTTTESKSKQSKGVKESTSIKHVNS